MSRPTLRRCILPLAASLALLGGCAHRPVPYDYSAYQKARPKSLLVLPPVNETSEVGATPSVWANATLPLSEAGYYVLPVTLVDETFKQNGVTDAHDAQELPYTKLREVFGADAAVYIKVTRYGTKYLLIGSETRVDVHARIVDLRDGAVLWEGGAFASSEEGGGGGGGGLAGLLVAAVVKQIIGQATDASFNYAAVANARMLGTPRYNGVLPGPRATNPFQPVAER